MTTRLCRILLMTAAVASLVSSTLTATAQNKITSPSAPVARIRVITDEFVLPGRLDKLAKLAAEARIALDHVYVETAAGDPMDWVRGSDLVILDTPRPMDVAKVEQRVGDTLRTAKVPWIRVGGGPPAFDNLQPQQARPLIAYYASGGEANARALFAFIAAWRAGIEAHAVPAPEVLPTTGFYHPAAPRLFSSLDEYLMWGGARWKPDAPRIATIIHEGLISGMETQVVDAVVAASEGKGLVPIVFWFKAGEPQALQSILGPANIDALIIATHLQNGRARAAEFLKLGVPVLQAVSFREGDAADWAKSESGMSHHLVAPFLALPETWGVSDPMVIDAVDKGAPVPIMPQVEALVAKASRLAALRHKPAEAKQLTLMFWNYPPGEKNLSASHLNVPRSIENLATALAAAGYDVPRTNEDELIRAAQAMLGAVYDSERLGTLLNNGLAEAIPVSRYRAWLEQLPVERRTEFVARWGEPENDPSVREVKGEKRFVIPRLKLGKLTIMPQLPRSGHPGESYHDTKEIPGHAYLAGYFYVREIQRADALIHLGTHGTQEWTPGKDRGLSVGDYPFLAVGDVPVFYPYIQDNIAEALQAKRRGRAVTISHQTPPFAPAGLYDELRNLNTKINEYAQLDEGPVRDRTEVDIRRAVTLANLHRDMGWTEQRIEAEFRTFVSELHDHLHGLARHAMPLGLHTLGVPAPAEHQLATVMQQLGEPFYRRLGAAPDDVFATDFEALHKSLPYRFLHQHLRDNVPITDVDDPALEADLKRAAELDRHLAETGEIEALLAGLAGRFVAPGIGGDPIRNPDVPSGRNLYAFEPDRVPTPAAYQAGGAALQQLIEAYRAEHNGDTPTKLGFSLWASETLRHLGLIEAQVLHALGLRPIWNKAGRVTRLEIISRAELGRPRIDVVLQVTSVYRDQLDGFMRLLADSIEKIAALEEADNPIAAHTIALAKKLTESGRSAAEARQLAALRIFSNAPGDYGTGLPGSVLSSTMWENDAPLAEAFLSRLQFAYGAKAWGTKIDDANLFAEQLRGTQAAVLSRSSKLHGILSTDHPFEYLGGLGLAIRHLDGKTPSLYVADLRERTSRITSAAHFLAAEMRARILNPHWIKGMQQEGYAGTLELINAANNLWGWQVAAPATVRADQWQAVHDTFVNDIRQLGLKDWFEDNNPTAQAQIIERLIEAIRKGYWDAGEVTRKELVARWQELAARHGVSVGEAATRSFIAKTAAGFGVQPPATGTAKNANAAKDPGTAQDKATSLSQERVRGTVLHQVAADAGAKIEVWRAWLGLGLVFLCVIVGALTQLVANVRLGRTGAAI